MAKQSANTIILSVKEDVLDEIEMLGVDELADIINKSAPDTEFLLIERLIVFADVLGSGKYCDYSTKKKDAENAYSKKELEKRAAKNYLFYKTSKEIVEYEKKNKAAKIFFNQTKQTNIHMPLDFYNFIGRKYSRVEKDYDINSGNVHCYIVNSTIRETFSKSKTDDTFEKLGREKRGKEIPLNEDLFTEISLHVKALGIGTKDDDLFYNHIRANVFATDKICILLVKKTNEINIYISFFRNPMFYKLNNMMMNAYLLKAFEKVTKEKEPEESRKGQAKWRNELAQLAIAQGDGDVDYVTCPFTLIEVKYPSKEATLLRASHIKAYSKCKRKDDTIDIAEAYDPDNGFLVTANIDALFDKHLITVDKDTGKIIWSKAVSKELQKAMNLPNDKIEKKYFESKKKYLAVHNAEFEKLENDR